MSEKMSLFPGRDSKGRRMGELSIPEHTMEALDNYFLRGYEPGSFLASVLTNNLYRAVGSADSANRHAIYEIVKWLTHSDDVVPHNSFGTSEQVADWLNDNNNIRTKFVDKVEKEYIWNTLKA